MALLTFTNKGIYCRQGDFYIDPWIPVNYAVTTHGHSDHVCFGSKHYLCHHLTKIIIKTRISEDLDVESLEYGQYIVRNGVKISFHPAGHVIGSAQVRLEYKGEIVVISGDYKLEDDHISTPFEPIKCHTYVSESTFGLPVYHWKPQKVLFDEMKHWAAKNIEESKTTVLIAYSLGKAQRLLKNLSGDYPIYVHSSIAKLNDALINSKVALPPYLVIDSNISKDNLQKGILIVPPVLKDSKWIKSLPAATGICSGWMQIRSHRRWQSADAGFALSDHADWPGLLSAVRATGAEHVWVTHGYTSAFSRFLSENGINATAVDTRYGMEEVDENKIDIKEE